MTPLSNMDSLLLINIIYASALPRAVLPCNEYDFYHLNGEAYVLDGDVYIGALYGITDYGEGLKCSKRLRPEYWVMEFIEATVFAVKKVNEDKRLLPGITLGLVMLDCCRTMNAALAKGLHFLPKAPSNDCAVDLRPARNESSSKNGAVPRNVVGVIGTFSSSSTVMLSYLYSVAKMPLLSFMATTDQLSDKSSHPYFFRVIPPDRFQVMAILRFIHANGWSFISMLYERGTYGENAFDTFKQISSEFGICLATSHKLHALSDFHAALTDLLSFPRARVVIVFLAANSALHLFKVAMELGAIGRFIWIGSDGISERLIHHRELAAVLLGSFVVNFHSKDVPGFPEYFWALNPTTSGNPWLKQYWETHGNCSFDAGSCDVHRKPSVLRSIQIIKGISLVMDGVLTFAHALHHHIERSCPNVSSGALSRCISRELVREHIMNSSFKGFTGNVKFDSNGDLRGLYEIRQILLDGVSTFNVSSNTSNSTMSETTIAIYDIQRQHIHYTVQPISWAHLTISKKIINRADLDSEIPESVCSRLCRPDEYKVQLKVTCCWDCRRCRDNEVITDNGTACGHCPVFTWPDDYLTSCLPIPFAYKDSMEYLSLFESALAIGGISMEAAVAAAFVVYRDTRAVKAASRELCALQMMGILWGYATVLLFQADPSPGICLTIYFTFCLSFAFLYAPLLIKALRLWRIFETSLKFNVKVRFVSPWSQIFFASALIFIQLVICIVVWLKYLPTARKTHPVPTEKYVELSCDMTLPGLISYLVYNLFLVTLCSIFAFKTRMLPENFNESRFISICVFTALIIWLSFIATYFTATKEEVRVLLLSMTLLINHTVALALLFAPKIYAAAYAIPSTSVTRQDSLTRQIESYRSLHPKLSNLISGARPDKQIKAMLMEIHEKILPRADHVTMLPRADHVTMLPRADHVTMLPRADHVTMLPRADHVTMLPRADHVTVLPKADHVTMLTRDDHVTSFATFYSAPCLG
ncbi:hypothetical protein Btru_023451 [Bulinus truncatus]|nr:hypothetical protein Btru_023451 [Bulinus truncatus]